MNDPWNPSAGEVEAWAYDAEAPEPCQEFELALTWSRHENVLLACASDPGCPKRKYFLHVLYFIVGNAVRSGDPSTPIIAGFIERGDEYRHPDVQTWQRRSRELMKNPESFDYELWCAGKLAGADSVDLAFG